MSTLPTNENLIAVSVAIHCPSSSSDGDMNHSHSHNPLHHHNDHNVFQHNNGSSHNNERNHSPMSAMSLSFDHRGHQQQQHCTVPSIGLSGNESSAMLCHHDLSSAHLEYSWDDLASDPGDYSMFLRKGESPHNSGK